MQAAAQEATRRRADGDAVQAVMGDDTIQGQIAEMTANPEVLRQTQEQSEALLKRVCGELVEGVREYREDFEPDADALIEKFADIQNNGYEAFVKYSLSDVKVKNAVINALYDEMEQAQKERRAAHRGGRRRRGVKRRAFSLGFGIRVRRTFDAWCDAAAGTFIAPW